MSNQREMRSVAVTGLGFITCIGLTKQETTARMRAMQHGICQYPPFQKPEIPVKTAAPIPGFDTEAMDPEDWTYPDKYKGRIPLRTLRSLAPHGLYAFCAMLDALEDAGLSPAEISDPGTGLFTASVGSPARIYRHMDRLLKVGPLRNSPLSIVSSIPGTLNFNLVSHFKIQGASTGFVSACASSGHALGYAHDEIALGRHDCMIVVGAEDFNAENILSFASMQVLTPESDPDKASRPFDKNRNGFVGTGGAVVMILESEERARARGASIYSRYLGWGQGSDGYHVAIAHPEGRGLATAMDRALKSSGLQPADINYVNAHATSTPAGDLAEIRALKSIFGENGHSPGISSTKALTGHALSLSSIMESAFSVLAMKEGFMPGSANIEELDPAVGQLDILRETKETRPRFVMSNSSGFGGANVAVVFGAPD